MCCGKYDGISRVSGAEHSSVSPSPRPEQVIYILQNFLISPHMMMIYNWILAETEEYGAIFLGEPKASFSPVVMIGASGDQQPHTE